MASAKPHYSPTEGSMDWAVSIRALNSGITASSVGEPPKGIAGGWWNSVSIGSPVEGYLVDVVLPETEVCCL